MLKLKSEKVDDLVREKEDLNLHVKSLQKQISELNVSAKKTADWQKIIEE